jgi:hypothetical protein
MKGADFIRPLGCMEHFFHLYAQVWPLHFCLCAEVEAAVGLDALRSALDQVRERHPIMRARIGEDAQFGAEFYKSLRRSRSRRPLSEKMETGVRPSSMKSGSRWAPA